MARECSGREGVTKEQLGILNSMLTFAAENIPGGLSADEQQAFQVFNRWAGGQPFYAVDVGSTQVGVENDGEIYVDTHGERLLHAKIKAHNEARVLVGPGDVIELVKEYGPLVFMNIKITVDVENGVWVVERYTLAEDRWEVVERIEAQVSTDFQE